MPVFWQGKSVLVTGATGFLGGWLIHDLLEHGANVKALVRPNRNRGDCQFFHSGLDQRTEVITGNVWDKELLEHTLNHQKIDVIFHTAMAGGGVQATLAEPIECLRSTVESTWHLLDSIRQHRQECVMVVCSSDKAYGNQELPYRETQPLMPRHPQEVAKASQDLLTQSFGKVYGLNVAVTRCANFFGPYDFNLTRIIPYVAKCCALGEQAELRSDGRFVRGFLAIEEGARAHLMLAEQLSSRPELRGEVFNFSYEVQMSVIDIVDRILEIARSNQKPTIANTVSHEIQSMSLSCDKARRILQWAPQRSFESGLCDTVKWYLHWFRAAGRAGSSTFLVMLGYLSVVSSQYVEMLRV
jgi:dTDP-glucose 4,6-dehydratase